VVNEKQAEYLQDILSSGQHLLSLINDILDLSKVEAGRMELAPAAFHLPQALENAVTLVKERAARHGISLKLDNNPGRSPGSAWVAVGRKGLIPAKGRAGPGAGS